MKNKLQIFGWSMYDFANTIYSALFVTVYFPLFVTLKGGTAFHVGLTFSLSMLLAGLLVPFLGAIADITKRKKLFLIIFTILCCSFVLLTGFFNIWYVLLFALLANFFYHASLDVYDALLVNLSTPKNIGIISGIGTAVGYLGTILSVAVAFLIGLYYGYENIQGIQIVFIVTAALFFLFSLFTFFLVKEKSKFMIIKPPLKQAFKNVIFTIKNIKKFKFIWLFLLASFLYTDGANTAIIFLFLFGRDQIGLSLAQFLPIYVLMALASAVGAVIFGKITDKLGHKRTLNLILSLWVIVILILYFKTNYTTFLAVGILGGALLGGLWTTTRPLLVDLAPKAKIAELFGYQGLTEKFSGVIGPALFGFIATAIGFKQALLIVIALFLLGALTLKFVKVNR
ncbi:MFS transporter [Candidatus Woesearchaeota archaeon]|nr:MFS transporter [Candidatus Woesearchaeota archaeon]